MEGLLIVGITVPTYNKTSYHSSSKLLPTVDGPYTFEASYNGVACFYPFSIAHSLGISKVSDADTFKIYPNPINGDFLITAIGIENENYTFTLTNSTGQIIKTEKVAIENNKFEKTFSFASFSEGVYFMISEGAKSRTVKKIMKNN